MPHEFTQAVAHADYILELQAGLDHDEMPPAWKWPFVKEMNEHIAQVQKQRRDRISNPGAGTPADDDDLRPNALLGGGG